jgi:hypothetical protein
MARALLLAAFVATSAGYVMNAPSPTSTRSGVQMFGGKKKITVSKPDKPMFSTQDFLAGKVPAKSTMKFPVSSPFAKKTPVVTKKKTPVVTKKKKQVGPSGNPIEGFEGLIASTFVIVLLAKATIFAPAPEPTGPPAIVIAMIMSAFGVGAWLAMTPDPVKPVESWYDAGYRLDGSFVKPVDVDPAAAKAEAILKKGMRVGAKTKI